MLLALTHGFAKAGLFLSAGVLQKAAGHDRIDALGPASQALPGVTLGIALASVALIGLPPSGTFLGKWILLTQAIESGQWWWVPVIMAGTLLAAAYCFRILAGAFGPGQDPGESPGPGQGGASAALRPGPAMQVPGLVLGLVAVALLGLGAEPLWGLLGDLATGPTLGEVVP